MGPPQLQPAISSASEPPLTTRPPGELPRTPSRRSSGLSRRTTAERIDEILQTGRERAELNRTLSNPPRSSMPRSPDRTRPTLLDRRRPSYRPNGDRDDSSADERTVIVSRGDHVSYQSTATSDAASTRGRTSARWPESAQVGGPGREDVGRKEEEPRRRPWYKAVIEPFRSIELENKGSVARDHLAIERTFLAWLRTSLAFASIGIAVTQLFRLNTSLSEAEDAHTLSQLGKPLGATFLGISIVILMLGYRRFTESQRWVMKGKFPASRGVILLVTFLAFALAVASLVVVVVVHPRDKEL